jgi:uncharacterized protein (TIGR02996 family)/excisionase family DNA binding protein
MSSTEQGLLQQVIETPSDDTPRLLYADWLDDHGRSPRADFIRTQVHLARSPECGHRFADDSCERCGWLRTEDDLLNRHGNAWLAALPTSLPGEAWQWCRRTTWHPLPTRPRMACFQRGFVSFVLLSTDEFLDNARRLVREHPLERIQLANRWPATATAGYFWTMGEHPGGAPDQIPSLLCNLAPDWFPGGQLWETDADALEALSQVCLTSARSNDHLVGTVRQVFTTGQVAQMCHVSQRTVRHWFDAGRLRGYRIPGSQDRRIPRDQLIHFLREHGMLAASLAGD